MRTASDTQGSTGGTGPVSRHEVARAQLFLLLERARLLAGGARYSLANIAQITIGRGATRAAERVVERGLPTLCITVPDERMSTHHVCIRLHNGCWKLEDCQSRNGSHINRSRLDSAVLSDGDVIELGRTLFRFRSAVTTPVNSSGDVDSSELRGLPKLFGTVLPWLGRDLETLATIARSDVAVLLLGDTGTGKELLARGIHEESRSSGRFVAVNCGAVPSGLVESLLFGHKRGAFSGATQDEMGFIRAADGGTLFLDEVADLPPSSQVALLRVLQEREVIPVGSTYPIGVRVRIVSATHRPLEALVETGAFRQDLFARLSSFTHRLPTLEERIDDMGVLVATLLHRMSGDVAASTVMSADFAHALITRPWLHNVRELEQYLKVATLLAKNGRIELPQSQRATTPEARPATEAALVLSSDEKELCEALVAKMIEHRGNITQVGEDMGKDRRQIQRWVKRFGIDAQRFRV